MIEILITVLVAPGIIALIVHRIIKAKKYREQVQSVTSLDRGTWSERDLIPKLLDKCGIDKRVIYHDLYIRKENGTYTQIDLAVPTPQGIIVFEVKDYSGWIFGNGNSKYWMQILAYGEEKHQFYNPIWQNRTHINALRKLLPNNPDVPIFNIVVFYGNSEFKDLNYDTSGRVRVIYNTQVVELVKHIKSLAAVLRSCGIISVSGEHPLEQKPQLSVVLGDKYFKHNKTSFVISGKLSLFLNIIT